MRLSEIACVPSCVHARLLCLCAPPCRQALRAYFSWWLDIYYAALAQDSLPKQPPLRSRKTVPVRKWKCSPVEFHPSCPPAVVISGMKPETYLD